MFNLGLLTDGNFSCFIDDARLGVLTDGAFTPFEKPAVIVQYTMPGMDTRREAVVDRWRSRSLEVSLLYEIWKSAAYETNLSFEFWKRDHANLDLLIKALARNNKIVELRFGVSSIFVISDEEVINVIRDENDGWTIIDDY